MKRLNFPTFIVALVTILVIGAAVLPGLRIRQYANDGNPPDDAAYVMDETTANKHILHSQLRFRITNGLATVTYVNSLTNPLATTNFVIAQSTNGATVAAGTGITVATNATSSNTTYTVSSSVTTNGLATTNYVNTATNGLVTDSVTNGLATTSYVNDATNTLSAYVDKAASNRVAVAAGANVTVTTNGSAGVETYTVAANSTTIHSEFDNILITNALNRIISRVASTVTTQQIDVVAGPSVYYWPLVNSNIVCQFTNMWTSQVSNRVIDFFFNGGAADKTVTFVCPNPGGVAFRWGVFSVTNGATSFTITNGHTGSASTSPFDTNVIEGFYSPGL